MDPTQHNHTYDTLLTPWPIRTFAPDITFRTPPAAIDLSASRNSQPAQNLLFPTRGTEGHLRHFLSQKREKKKIHFLTSYSFTSYSFEKQSFLSLQNHHERIKLLNSFTVKTQKESPFPMQSPPNWLKSFNPWAKWVRLFRFKTSIWCRHLVPPPAPPQRPLCLC